MAVELQLHIPSDGPQPGIAAMAKEYLDLLALHALPDDAVVDHLLVLRFKTRASTAVARIRVLPMSIFRDEYDRAFRVVAERGSGAFLGRKGDSLWGLTPFTDHDREVLTYHEHVLSVAEDLDDEESEQLAEDPDAWVDLDVPPGYEEFADPEVRNGVRRELEPSCARRRGDWFCDHGFDVRHRPGAPPQWLDDLHAHNLADVVSLPEHGPGVIAVGAPPKRPTGTGNANWAKEVRGAWAQNRRSWAWRRLQFGGPLVLDVALVGGAGRHKDVDNVAHDVIRAFNVVFADTDADIAGYRVYRTQADTQLVRATVLPAVRLRALSLALRQSRRVIREQTAARLRAAPFD